MKKSKTFLFILLFVVAHFFHHLLTAVLIPLLPFIRDGFGLSYAQSGAVVSAFSIAYGFGQLPAGWLSDRLGPRYLLLAGISGVAIAGLFIGLSTSYIGLLVFLVLLGILGGGYHPSASPLIAGAVDASQRGKAIGLHIVGGSASNFLSPLVAVFIAGFLGWRGSYITISVPVFAFGVWLFFLMLRNDIRAPRTEEAEDKSTSHKVPKSLKGPKRPNKSLAIIIIILVMTASVGASIGSVVSFITLLAVDSLGVDQKTAALLLSIYFASGMAAAPIGGMLADRFGPLRILFSLAFLSGPVIILIGITPIWSLLAFLMLGLGSIAFFRMTSSEIFFVSRVPQRHRSTVLGVYYFAGMEGRGIISPILGGAIDSWGFTASFTVLGAVLSILVSICAVLYFSVHRKQPAVLP